MGEEPTTGVPALEQLRTRIRSSPRPAAGAAADFRWTVAAVGRGLPTTRSRVWAPEVAQQGGLRRPDRARQGFLPSDHPPTMHILHSYLPRGELPAQRDLRAT